MRIVLKYCGNCNPEIDLPKIIERLQEKLKEKKIEFVSYPDPNSSNLLLLCGCRKGCLDRHEISGGAEGVLIVKGRGIECPPFPFTGMEEESLPRVLLTLMLH